MAVLQGPVTSVMSVCSTHNSLCYRACSCKCRCRDKPCPLLPTGVIKAPLCNVVQGCFYDTHMQGCSLAMFLKELQSWTNAAPARVIGGILSTTIHSR